MSGRELPVELRFAISLFAFPHNRLALLGDLPPVAAAAAGPTVAAWADRAASLTAFVHRRPPRTLPPLTVMATPGDGGPKS